LIKKLAIIGLLLSNVYGTSAHADWQYTKWGMTTSQVQAASGGAATFLTTEEQAANSAKDSDESALMKAPYISGQFQFTAYFSFFKNTNQLAHVKLQLHDAEKAASLLGSLRTKYGSPQSERLSDLFAYSIWYTKGDQLTYADVVNKRISVSYKPRKSADNEGL
jgi:hypothetical protein